MPVYNPFEVGGQPMAPKSPGSDLDYACDFAAKTNGNGRNDWLDTVNGEEISTFTVTPPTGITLHNQQLVGNNTGVGFYVSGGTDGEDYPIIIDVTTNAAIPRTNQVTMIIQVRQR